MKPAFPTLSPNFPIAIVALVAILIISMLILCAIAMKNKRQQPEREPREPTPKQPKPIQKDRSAEVIDTLNWMVEHQIISPTEYNKLMVKSLPFME